jgi:hypothetical protein
VSGAAPGRVLRLAVIAWGLGDLVLGRRLAAIAWLLAEALGLVLVVVVTILFADTTWYLLPYLAGMAFIGAWTAQAVAAYRRAGRQAGSVEAVPTGSPAAVIAWLTVPLLAWGTGFWLFAADAATPGAVLDRFVTAWPAVNARGWDPDLAEQPNALSDAATVARDRLRELCAAGQLADDCAAAPGNLLRDIRIRLTSESATRASAVAEVVRFERRPSRFLGIFAATELVPVPIEAVLRLELGARPAGWGAARWTIVTAAPG